MAGRPKGSEEVEGGRQPAEMMHTCTPGFSSMRQGRPTFLLFASFITTCLPTAAEAQGGRALDLTFRSTVASV